MAVGREQRMVELLPRIRAEFGESVAQRVVDVLTLTEFAWHDCYGEVAPPSGVVEDIFVVASGRLEGLIEAAALAVNDWRDLRLAADDVRSRRAAGESDRS